MGENSEPLVLGLDYLTLRVADVDRSIAFYGTILGLEVLHRTQHFALLELPNTKLGLHGGGSAGPTSVNLHLRVPDLDAAYTWLKERGVTFEGEPRTQPWGLRSVSFLDPDGYTIELIDG
jgi:catechol 2,3-dioxygenase-like lactoylglutathione lyase family enzyme